LFDYTKLNKKLIAISPGKVPGIKKVESPGKPENSPPGTFRAEGGKAGGLGGTPPNLSKILGLQIKPGDCLA
jgi:hypothetical protein